MKFIFSYFLCFLFFCSHAQVRIFTNYKMHGVEKRVERSFKKYKRTYTKEATDSSLKYTFTDTLTRPATFIYRFDNLKKCVQQDVILDCDSCFRIILNQHLKNKFENWHYLKNGKYYASFPYNVVMEGIFSDNKFILRYTKTRKKEIKYLLQ